MPTERRNIASFSSQIGRYFALIFVLAIGAILSGWYLGVPWLGLRGEVQGNLGTAIALLEQGAAFQQSQLLSRLQERRGDMLILAENRVIARMMDQGIEVKARITKYNPDKSPYRRVKVVVFNETV